MMATRRVIQEWFYSGFDMNEPPAQQRTESEPTQKPSEPTVDAATTDETPAAPTPDDPPAAARAVILPDQPEAIPRCLNCDHPVTLLYCSNCGQSLRQVRVSLHTLLMDFLGDYFTFDSKLLRSMKPLFFKPGELTLEFMRGRRASYIPPLRMYIFFSILFFLSINLTRGPVNAASQESATARELMLLSENETLPEELRKANGTHAAVLLENEAAKTFNITRKAVGLSPIEVGTNPKTIEDKLPFERGSTAYDQYRDALEEYDDAMDDVGELREGKFKFNRGIRVSNSEIGSDTEWGEYFEQKIEEKVKHLKSMDPEVMGATLLDTFFKLLPNVMFLLLPLFAFYLKIIYIRRDPLYIDHLITAFHYHAFVYITFSLVTLLQALCDNDVFSILSFLAMVAIVHWYLYAMLLRVYGQGYIKTFFKFGLIWLIYGITLNVAMGITILVSLFQI